MGELISLGTALCWTLTVVGFESAGKRVGSLSVNIIRLVIGFMLLSITLFIIDGTFLPINIMNQDILWLSISGFIGLLIGDLFLFQAFVDVGGRISLLIYSSTPIISAVLGWFVFGEILVFQDILGMVITLSAISFVILLRQSNKQEQHKHITRGILFAFLGAIAQAIGLVFSKLGLADNYSAFAATQVRIIPAIFGFLLFITLKRGWKDVGSALKNKTAMMYIGLGSIFGPFLGVSSSLLALRYTSLGISTTIAQLNVILIIPFSVWLFKEKVNVSEMIAAVVALVGVALLFT